jgi:hypothetical protein
MVELTHVVHSIFMTAIIKFSVIAQYCQGDQSKEDEMGGACGAHGGGEGCIQHFGWEA